MVGCRKVLYPCPARGSVSSCPELSRVCSGVSGALIRIENSGHGV
ncbi:hypothetical protein M6B38_311985 [Iris pallida]|uniref:Uncharacterized protein n=1 Tax=Iris pallida TaxID=29817 RepID=A0AAX6HG83_IRIPA|nr:hypothetical protein M6B38_311985 [Iris pallida]